MLSAHRMVLPIAGAARFMMCDDWRVRMSGRNGVLSGWMWSVASASGGADCSVPHSCLRRVFCVRRVCCWRWVCYLGRISHRAKSWERMQRFRLSPPPKDSLPVAALNQNRLKIDSEMTILFYYVDIDCKAIRFSPSSQSDYCRFTRVSPDVRGCSRHAQQHESSL